MTDRTHPNHVERYEASTDQLDALSVRSNEQAQAEREARQRAAEWPSVIERAVALLTRRSTSQAEALAAIDARIAALEASMGLGQG